MTAFERKIARFIEDEHLFGRNDRLLAALSGGADSVALLLVLKRLGYAVDAVHCNFHLRGEESERDAAFCEELCRHENIPFHRKDFDTLSHARARKESIELSARNLRYGYFEQLRCELPARFVCVGHHRDDNVETVLMNLVRGTGLVGLRGILPLNGSIARPLLCVSRREIEDYLCLLKQEYVTDSTNLQADVTRNKIRLKVLPLLSEINPQAAANIDRAARHLREAGKMLTGVLAADDGDGVILVKDVLSSPSPSFVLYERLKKYAFSPAQISEIAGSLEGPSGRRWLSPTHELVTDRGRLLLEPRSDSGEAEKVTISGPGAYKTATGLAFSIGLHDVDGGFVVGREPFRVCMDAEKVSFPLVVRHVKAGDRISLNEKGSKLVSDILCDCKLSLFERRRQYVVADASRRVVWIVGIRLSSHVYVTSASKKVVTIACVG